MRRTRCRRRSTRCCWSTSPVTPRDLFHSDAGGVEGGDRVAIEPHASGGQQSPQLIEAGGAGDRRGDAWPGNDPGDRDLGRSDALFFGRRLDRRENLKAAWVQIFADVARTARALREIGLRTVFAGQESGGKREEADDAQPLLLTQRFERFFVAGAL